VRLRATRSLGSDGARGAAAFVSPQHPRTRVAPPFVMRIARSVVVTSVVVLCSVACSSASTTGVGGDGTPGPAAPGGRADGSSSQGTPGPGNGTTPPGPGNGTPGTPGGADGGPSAPPPGATESSCAQKTYLEDCFDCCDSFHPQGATFGNQALYTCVCRADQCGTPCAQSFCSQAMTPPTPGDACDVCLGNTIDGNDAGVAQCSMEADQKCQTNADCAADVKCYQTQACDTKPAKLDVDGGVPGDGG
jgi:hypothetical protein